MTLCAAVYAGGGSLLGSRYEQDRSVETEVFADQQEWDRFLSGYFQLYKSYSYYADQRGEEWPADFSFSGAAGAAAGTAAGCSGARDGKKKNRLAEECRIVGEGVV